MALLDGLALVLAIIQVVAARRSRPTCRTRALQRPTRAVFAQRGSAGSAERQARNATQCRRSGLLISASISRIVATTANQGRTAERKVGHADEVIADRDVLRGRAGGRNRWCRARGRVDG